MAALQSRMLRSPVASTSSLRSLSTSSRLGSAKPYSNPHAVPRPEDMHRMNKYSHRITSDKTQGASQVRSRRGRGSGNWPTGGDWEGGRSVGQGAG